MMSNTNIEATQLIKKAIVAYQSGRAQACINICTELIFKNQADHTIQHLLALSYRALKEFTKAEHHIGQAYKINRNEKSIAIAMG